MLHLQTRRFRAGKIFW